MPDWLSELRLLAEAEFHNRRVLATLATTAKDGTPRARMVIVRDILKDGSLVFTTAAESEKVEQLQQQPVAEIHFWFAHERQQYRMRGPVELIREGDLVLSMWNELSDNGRALFYWPPPGQPRQPSQHFPQHVASSVAPPDSFVVLKLVPRFVETLDLNEHPHGRQRWARLAPHGTWAMEAITP